MRPVLLATVAALGIALTTGESARLGRVRTAPRRNELALDQVIVTWPG
jgi:hypothetical protein